MSNIDPFQFEEIDLSSLLDLNDEATIGGLRDMLHESGNGPLVKNASDAEVVQRAADAVRNGELVLEPSNNGSRASVATPQQSSLNTQSSLSGNGAVARDNSNGNSAAEASATATAGGATQTVTPSQGKEEKEEKEEQPVCVTNDVLIKCMHAPRGYVMSLAAGDPTLQGKYVYQVISKSHAPDVIEVSVDGSCGFGHPASSRHASDVKMNKRPNVDDACPSVKIKGDQVDVHQGGTVKVQVYPKKPGAQDESFSGFLKRFIALDSLQPNSYKISACECSGSPGLVGEVQAFPFFEWGGELKLGYEQAGEKNRISQAKLKGFKEMKALGEWVVEGGINLKYDEHEWGFGSKPNAGDPTIPKHKQDELAGELFGGVKKLMESAMPFLSNIKGDYADLNITWPRLALKGKWAAVEYEKQYKVDLAGEIELAFDPLIDATFTVDILALILRCGGPYGILIDEIRKQAAEGFDSWFAAAKAKILLNLTVGGAIKGGVKWVKKVDQSWVTTGELTADLGFSVEGEASVEGHVFKVVFAAGYKFGLKGVDASIDPMKSVFRGLVKCTSEDNQPLLQGQLLFNGLKIYYTFFKHVGAQAVAQGKVDSNASAGGPFGGGTTDNSGNQNMLENKTIEENDVYVICEPKSWPAGDQTVTMNIAQAMRS